jgi:8-oxo-dGTP pyrophosphatase MutT (NUDIX family)
MERIGSQTLYDGKVIGVRVDRFRLRDGEEVERELVTHPGSVAIVAHDGKIVHMVRQPREAVEADDLLELPAGKLDVEGESRLECAKRELAEEIGVAAAKWTELKTFYASPGFAQEEVTVFLATGLEPAEAEADDDERIERVEWPLDELDSAIRACRDSSSLIGLLILQRLREDGSA